MSKFTKKPESINAAPAEYPCTCPPEWATRPHVRTSGFCMKHRRMVACSVSPKVAAHHHDQHDNCFVNGDKQC